MFRCCAVLYKGIHRVRRNTSSITAAGKRPNSHCCNLDLNAVLSIYTCRYCNAAMQTVLCGPLLVDFIITHSWLWMAPFLCNICCCALCALLSGCLLVLLLFWLAGFKNYEMNFSFSSLSDAHSMWAVVASYSLNFAATGNMNSMSTCSYLCKRIQGQADQWTLIFKQSKPMLIYRTEAASRKDINPVLGLQTAPGMSWLLMQFSAAVNKSWTYCICLPGLNKCPFFGCAPFTEGSQGVNTCHSWVQWRDRESLTAGISGC